MASDLSSAVFISTSEMEDSTDNGNGYPKDLEYSNGNEWKDIKDEYNPSCPNVLKNSSPKLETHSNEQGDLTISAPDKPSSEGLKKLSAVSKVLKETSNGTGKISTKNGTALSARNAGLPSSNEDESIQPTLTEETESTAKPQPSYDETKVEEKLVCEKLASAMVIQSQISEKTESTEGNHPAISQKIEGKEKPVSKETVSTTAIQPPFAKKTESVETTKLARSEKAEETEMKTAVKTYVNMMTMTGGSEFHRIGTPIISSVSEKAHMDSNFREFNEKTTNLEEVATRIGMKSPNAGKGSPTSLPPALDTKEFFSLLDTEEYKNAYMLSMPCGNVIVSPTEAYEQTFQDIDLSWLPKSTTYKPPTDSNKPFTSTDEFVLNEDTCFQISLVTLLSMFSRWVNRNLKRCSKVEQNPNIEDFVECTKKELKYALDLLRLMNKRIDSLLTAVYGLPDPSCILPPEFQSERISIRATLKDSGLKVQRKIRELEAEGFEFFDIFVLHFANNENTRTDDIDPRLMVITANAKFHNLVAKTAGDFLTLGKEIEKFRDNIRDFCLEMDKFV